MVTPPLNYGGRAAVLSRRDASEGGFAPPPEDSRAAKIIRWLPIPVPAMRRLRTRLRKTSYCSVTAPPQSNPADSNRREILLRRGTAAALPTIAVAPGISVVGGLALRSPAARATTLISTDGQCRSGEVRGYPRPLPPSDRGACPNIQTQVSLIFSAMGRLFSDPRERHARKHAPYEKKISPKKIVGPRACAMAANRPKRLTPSGKSSKEAVCSVSSCPSSKAKVMIFPFGS